MFQINRMVPDGWSCWSCGQLIYYSDCVRTLCNVRIIICMSKPWLWFFLWQVLYMSSHTCSVFYATDAIFKIGWNGLLTRTARCQVANFYMKKLCQTWYHAEECSVLCNSIVLFRAVWFVLTKTLLFCLTSSLDLELDLNCLFWLKFNACEGDGSHDFASLEVVTFLERTIMK